MQKGGTTDSESNPEDNQHRSFILSAKGSFRLQLKRKLALGEPAELLAEKNYGKTYSWSNRFSIRLFFVILAALLFASLLIIYYSIMPRFLSSLPAQAVQGHDQYVAYTRTIEGFIDYFPLVSSSNERGLATIADGGSFAFRSQADVVPGVGTQGTLHVELDNVNQTVEDPDFDLSFKLIDIPDPNQVDAFVLFNELPFVFTGSIPESILKAAWFEYDSQKSKLDHEGINNFLSNFSQQGQDRQQKILDILWRHALEQRVLSWSFEQVARLDYRGAWVSDIRVSFEKDNITEMIETLRTDNDFKNLAQSLGSDETPETIIKIIESMRSGSAIISVGIFDRTIYDAQWHFDMFNRDIGSIRGSFNTSLSQQTNQPQIVVPGVAADISDILFLILPQTALSSIDVDPANITDDDSDGDGLSNDDELVYGTDPQNPDSDGDGFTDGEEVETGYNPLGRGRLEDI